MKYITFAIPSYNSESYLYKAVDSLISLGDEIEVIIINDGSTDNTLKIALEYERKYPQMIRVIDKENGGHGSGVNKGLELATGLYYKVLDSDDWIDQQNSTVLLNIIKKQYNSRNLADLIIMDFVYEHTITNSQYIRTYKDNLPSYQMFGWNEIKKKFKYSKTLLMHSQIFKTSVLKESKVKLPEHTFYVDNIFSYTPLPFVETIYYIPMEFYHYYIGRSDQSIQFNNIVDRYQQQMKVMRQMYQEYSYEEIKKLPKGLRSYIKHLLAVTMIVTQMFTTAKTSKKRKQNLKALWNYFKHNDIKLYRYLKYRSYNVVVTFLPWRIKGFIMKKGYFYLTRKVKLG